MNHADPNGTHSPSRSRSLFGADSDDDDDDFAAIADYLLDREINAGQSSAADAEPYYETISKASRQLATSVESAWDYASGRVIQPPFNLYKLANYFELDPWHARCCRLKALLVAGRGRGSRVATTVVARDENRDEETLHAGERKYLREWIRRINPTTSFERLIYRIQLDIEVTGNAYVEVVRDGLGRPIELYRVPAVNVRRGCEAQAARGFWQIDPKMPSRKVFFKDFNDPTPIDSRDGREMTRSIPAEYEATELRQFMCHHPSSIYYGVPEWLSAMIAMDGSGSAMRWNADRFAHNTIPRKAIFFKGGQPSKEVKRRAREYFSTPEPGRNHSPLVLWLISENDEKVDIDIKDLESGPQEAGFLHYLDSNRDMVVAAHGVPPSMVGIPPSRGAGRVDNDAERRNFRVFSIEPRQGDIEDALNEDILPEIGITDWVLHLGDLDLSDSESQIKRAAQIKELVASALLTINEGRRELGREPYHGIAAADEPFVMQPGGALFLRHVDPSAPAVLPIPGGPQAKQTNQAGQAGGEP